MSKIENIVQTLEDKIDRIIDQFGLLKEENAALKKEIEILKSQNKDIY